MANGTRVSGQIKGQGELNKYFTQFGQGVEAELWKQAMALGIPQSAFTGGSGMATNNRNTGFAQDSSYVDPREQYGGGFEYPSGGGYGGSSYVDDFMQQLPPNFWGDYFDQSGLAAYEKRGGLGSIMEGLMGVMANRDDLFRSTRPKYTQFIETSGGRADKLDRLLDEIRANPIEITETPDAVWSLEGGPRVSVGQKRGTKALETALRQAQMAQEAGYQAELRNLDQAGLGALSQRAAYEGDYLNQGTAEWNNLAPLMMAYSEAAKDPYRDLQGPYMQMMGAGVQQQESAAQRALQKYGWDLQYDNAAKDREARKWIANLDPKAPANTLAGMLGLGGLGLDIFGKGIDTYKGLSGLFSDLFGDNEVPGLDALSMAGLYGNEIPGLDALSMADLTNIGTDFSGVDWGSLDGLI